MITMYRLLVESATRNSKKFNSHRWFSSHCLQDLDLSHLQNERILKTLNTASPYQLTLLANVTLDMADSVLQYREIYGDIEETTSWHAIKAIDPKAIEEICKQISQKETSAIEEICKQISQKETSSICTQRKVLQQKFYMIPRNQITPKFKASELPSSIVSYHIDLRTLSWLHMTSDLEVLAWEQRPLLNRDHLAYHHVQWYNKICAALADMPGPDKTSLYLAEQAVYHSPSIVSMTATIARARLDSIISTILTERCSQGEQLSANAEHKVSASDHSRSPRQTPTYGPVYKLKPAVTTEHFELDVGGQRVSGRLAVQDIEHGMCPPAEGVTVPKTVMRQWYKLGRGAQEIMGTCLLQAVAFYKTLQEEEESEHDRSSIERW